MKVNNQVASNPIGYYEAGKNFADLPCRLTHFTRTNFEKYNNGLPVIKEIRRVSKPGRRIYTKADSIPKIQSGLGIAIVSTSIGIMSDTNARLKNVGGEIICKVF